MVYEYLKETVLGDKKKMHFLRLAEVDDVRLKKSVERYLKSGWEAATKEEWEGAKDKSESNPVIK